MDVVKLIPIAAFVATTFTATAFAEGDPGSPNPPRTSLSNLKIPANLPPAARRAVMPDAWRNLGNVTCAAADTNAAGITTCSQMATHRFTTDNRDNGRYILHLRSPASHCAPIIYVAYVDAAEGNTTPYYFGALYPGASYARSISVKPGQHSISIGALGDTTMGGCNTSGIQSWSVDIRLEPDNAPT